jgi:uncharacterized repeat protein (TIGR01451 family)
VRQPDGKWPFLRPRAVSGLALVVLLIPGSARAADLSVGLHDSPDPVYVGSRLSYDLTVSNTGPDPATGVTVTIVLPRQADILRASGDRGACSVAGSTATCDLAIMEAGAVAAINVVVRPTAPGRVTSVAEAQASGAPDANPADNSARVVTRVRLHPGACSNVRMGTRARDLLRGTTGGDAIFGRAGDDVISGDVGGDCLSGQGGDDTLRGGPDLDTLFGDAGADTLAGGPGEDLALGGSGPDRIVDVENVKAGLGDDHIVAPPGAVVRCGPGQDVVRLLGTARLFDCEQTVAPPPPSSAPPSGGGGGGTGGGLIGGGGGGGGHRSRRRCTRRRCPNGGIPASVGARSSSTVASTRPRVP